MADFISREAAYKTLTEYYHHSSGVQHTVLREALNRVPTADVVPWEWLERFAEGRRIEYGAGMHWNYARDFVKEAKEAYKNGLVFCPSCGADTGGESDG